jgi:hypothetical protein
VANFGSGVTAGLASNYTLTSLIPAVPMKADILSTTRCDNPPIIVPELIPELSSDQVQGLQAL